MRKPIGRRLSRPCAAWTVVSDFDALGHLDYVVRYGKHQAEEYSYRMFADEIDAILKKLIDMGKSAGNEHRRPEYGLGFPNPHPDVLKRYRELGGGDGDGGERTGTGRNMWPGPLTGRANC